MVNICTPNDLQLLADFDQAVNNGKGSSLVDCNITMEELQSRAKYGYSVDAVMLYDYKLRFPLGTEIHTSGVVHAGHVRLVPGTLHMYFITGNTNYLIKESIVGYPAIDDVPPPPTVPEKPQFRTVKDGIAASDL